MENITQDRFIIGNNKCEYEIKAFINFCLLYKNYIKIAKLEEDKYSPYDCVVKDNKDNIHLIELKNYNQNYKDCERIKIYHDDEILIPKFTCNFIKIVNIYDKQNNLKIKEKVKSIQCINMFNDNITTKINLFDFFDEIIPYKKQIFNYQNSTYDEHIKIYNGNNWGKSQIRFSKSNNYCVFQENAYSPKNYKQQEFKIAFF